MGQFKIEITGIGGHGCRRDPKAGDPVYGCRRVDCPDCLTADFVERLAHHCTGSHNLTSATFTHWPGEPTEVVDRLTVKPTGYVEVTRERGDFAPKGPLHAPPPPIRDANGSR